MELITQKVNFKCYNNSLIWEATWKNHEKSSHSSAEDAERHVDKSLTLNLSTISGAYLYTGTPPHAFGTQSPKVAETVNRSKEFNLKHVHKTIRILNRDIDRLHWEAQDGAFPFDEIHGNFLPGELKIMAKEFVKRYHTSIDSVAETVIANAIKSNSDILTRGRQTLCAFTNQSVTAAVAYKRMYDFISKNTGMKTFNKLEWIQAFNLLFEKETIEYLYLEEKEYEKRIFCKATKQYVTVKKTKFTQKYKRTSTVEETREKMLELSTRFASYLKHKERGKLDRRAIASANMILRMPLHIVEEFHLELGKNIEGSTISVGGEEKKAKIVMNMSTASLETGEPHMAIQGTEDATKWNECLAPGAFALMHKYLFDDAIRLELDVPKCNHHCKTFSKIAVFCNFLMAMKEVQLGQGVMVENENYFSRLKWSDECIPMMNKKTLEWYMKIKDFISPDRKYVSSSSGMLMGMLNAGSTTLGLLAVSHRMNLSDMRVVTLRSSDDSMSLYLAKTQTDLQVCVEMNRRNLALLGINLSPDKTFFFREGFGEYTSWYMSGKFISQFGVETASIRPQGINPPDDFFSIARTTAIGLATLLINPLGATIRIRLGIDGVRRLWRIEKDYCKRDNISAAVLLMSDGGKNLWNIANCHLEELSFKETKVNCIDETNYLNRIRNPANPFSEDPREEITFSKELGTLVLEEIETPRTIFHYLKRSNRTVTKTEKQIQFNQEKFHAEASEIIHAIDPTTYVSDPKSCVPINLHLISILRTEESCCDLTEEETASLNQAIHVLEQGHINEEEEEEISSDFE